MSTAMKNTRQDAKPDQKKQAPSGLATVKSWLNSEEFKGEITKNLPKHMNAERFLRIAITATMRNPKILDCTQASILNCLLLLSQYGLECDGRRAYLIPYGTECTLLIDYKGLAELVMRSGLVSSIHADVVCENDDFEYDRGFITKHKINFRNPRGPAYAAYAVVRFKDGTEKTEVMPKDDIYAIRNRGQGWQAFKKGYAKQSPWDPKEPVIEYEMWKKTAFRRASKWVPLSAEIRDALSNEDDDEETIRDIGPAQIVTRSESSPSYGSKSEGLANLLASRMSDESQDSNQDDAAETSEDAGESKGSETESNYGPSQLRECVKFLDEQKAAGVECIDASPEGDIVTYSLPNGETIKVCDNANASTVKGQHAVDTLEKDSIQQVINIFDLAMKSTKKTK